jgi:L-lysine exporter family protein LysE/ArgO
MNEAFLTGFFLGISLIIAIGAQNAFVIRQGIIRQHIFYVALFCAVSDSILIIVGVTGISYFFNNFIDKFSNILFGLSSLWLFGYGFLKLRSGLKNTSQHNNPLNTETNNLINAISIAAVLTFMNPHVYLDTMVLIGSISQQFEGNIKIFYTLGACFASFVWFFFIGYGGKILAPLMLNNNAWRVLDYLIAIIMFYIAFNLAVSGNWL